MLIECVFFFLKLSCKNQMVIRVYLGIVFWYGFIMRTMLFCRRVAVFRTPPAVELCLHSLSICPAPSLMSFQ